MRVQIFVNGLNDVVGKIPFCSPFVWPISIRKNPYIDYSGAIRPVYVTHGVMKLTSYLAFLILIVILRRLYKLKMFCMLAVSNV